MDHRIKSGGDEGATSGGLVIARLDRAIQYAARVAALISGVGGYWIIRSSRMMTAECGVGVLVYLYPHLK